MSTSFALQESGAIIATNTTATASQISRTSPSDPPKV